MKAVTWIGAQGEFRQGVLRDGMMFDLGEWPADPAEGIRRFREAAAAAPRGSGRSLSSVRLGPPIPRPGKIICVGHAYRKHCEEQNAPIPKAPLLFCKFPTAVVGADAPIVKPAETQKLDYEAELAVVIGKTARSVPEDRAMDHVFGYMNFNDVSARDVQYAEKQWVRAKSFDTFAPCGPYVATTDEISDPRKLRIRCRVNGETRQDSDTSDLVFSIAGLVSYISRTATLLPGDVISTGTPSGVGVFRTPPVFLQPGDVVEIEIEGLGVLSNPVAAEARGE